MCAGKLTHRTRPGSCVLDAATQLARLSQCAKLTSRCGGAVGPYREGLSERCCRFVRNSGVSVSGCKRVATERMWVEEEDEEEEKSRAKGSTNAEVGRMAQCG